MPIVSLPVENTSQTDDPIFQTTPDDELLGRSKEDEDFLNYVVPNITVDPNGRIVLPLPFNPQLKREFPDNKGLAFKRTQSTVDKLRAKKPEILIKATEKMKQNFDCFPPKFIPVPFHDKKPPPGQACWIPLMIVDSKGKARIVFDAAA